MSVHKTWTRPAIALAALFVFALFGEDAEACSCAPNGPPCESFFRVDAVFVGTVRTISEFAGAPAFPYRGRVVGFSIERAFRGVQGAAVNIDTGMGGGDCGYSFKAGEQYLVYAYRTAEGSRLGTGICSRTRPIANADEDLRYIEGMPASGSGARVYGSVTHRERNLATGASRDYGPVPFIHLLLRGSAGAVDAQTDQRGRYEIGGIAPGVYDLQVVPPAAFSPKYLERKIELRDARACAVADFQVHYDGRISGVVLAADGHPAAGLSLEVIAVERTGASGLVPTLTGKTDSGGYYEFSDVPPGRYVVGVNLQRGIEPAIVYTRTFHPGTASPGAATIVEIGAGSHQQLEPLKLPPPRQRRTLTGQVVWSDGRPVPGAFVSPQDGEADWRQVAIAVRTDADGRFTFVVHDGLSYGARASFNLPDDPQYRQAQARAGPFIVSPRLEPLRLVLVAPIDR
jgi:hypothetical protein